MSKVNMAVVEVRCQLREMISEMHAHVLNADAVYAEACRIVFEGDPSAEVLRARITGYRIAIREGNTHTPAITRRMEAVVQSIVAPEAQEQPQLGARTKEEALGLKPKRDKKPAREKIELPGADTTEQTGNKTEGAS